MSIIKKVFVFCVVALLAFTLGGIAMGADFDWRQAEGETIRVLTHLDPWSDYVEKHLADFEELTGIKVILERFPYGQYYEKLQVEIVGGAGNLDAFSSQRHVVGKRFYNAGWYEPLDPYLSDPSLTDADYKIENIFSAVLKRHYISDTLVAIPLAIEVGTLFYRKDLLSEKGLDVPQTFDELEKVAKALTGDGMYGIAMRGKFALPCFQPFLFGYGAGFIKDGKPGFNTPEGVTALEQYARIMQNYAPPGASGFFWQENVTAFAQGKVAMFIDAVAMNKWISDPDKSQVVGKFGVAAVPAGPAGRYTWLGNWSVSVFKGSKKKKAAWLFAQWSSGLDVSRDLIRDGFATGIEGLWEDAEFKKTVDPTYLEAMKISGGICDQSYVPDIVRALEAREVIEHEVTAVIEKRKDAKTALDDAAKQVADLL